VIFKNILMFWFVGTEDFQNQGSDWQGDQDWGSKKWEDEQV